MKRTFIRVLSLVFVFATSTALPMESQNYRVLYSFAGGSDGSSPQGWLIWDGKGNLFGVTSEGGGSSEPRCPSGSYGCGTVFVVTPSDQEGVLHSFTDGNGGGYPLGGLTIGGDGALYGTTSSGSGSSVGGSVFKINPSNGKLIVIHTFSDGADGGFVRAAVLLDSHGNRYGTAAGGGNRTIPICQANGCGVVFKIDENGRESVLHTFTGPPDGWWPTASLIRDQHGNFYGTTSAGGADTNCANDSGCGTIFKINVHGKESVLYSFTSGADANDPQAALIRDEAGNFYGTTWSGGTVGYGTVYKLDPSNNLTVLHSFSGVDGANPQAALVRDSRGNLYGTSYFGGDSSCGYLGSGCGVVFRLDASGNYSLLYTFTGALDGGWPTGSLTLDAAGNLYGIASGGGILTQGVGNGVVFEITSE